MKKKDYIFKRTCILLCGRAIKKASGEVKKILHSQMVRMNKELDDLHKKNMRKVVRK